MKKLTLILFAVLLMSGFTALAQKKGTISFTSKNYDFGKLKEDGGVRSGNFEFTNIGNDTLRIINVSSGIGNITCDWIKTPVMPNGKGYVYAIFNPKNMPGTMNREISVYSNDPDQPIVKLIIKAEVEAHVRTEADQYPNIIGNLRFGSYQVSMQNINSTETKTDTLKMYNEWGQPMSISFKSLPLHMTCKAVPQNLKSKQKGYILVTYDAAKRNDYGYVNDRFTILTNDTNQSEKSISVSANIVEDFSNLTPEQLSNAAKIKFETTTYNFDTITEGKDVEYDFKFTNIGNEDLFIRKVKAS